MRHPVPPLLAFVRAEPDWSRTYPKQPEIWRVPERAAEKLRACGPTSASTQALLGPAWDEDASLWRLETGAGQLHRRRGGRRPGAAQRAVAAGPAGHRGLRGHGLPHRQWNHDHDLTGERVAVVGTGASAIQAVPEIAPGGQLDVIQRTPPWVVPHRDRPITRVERFLYKPDPGAPATVRAGVYCRRELLVPGLVYRPRILKVAEKLARKHIADQVPDPELRAKVTPNYTIGCKRILPSNKWYPALGRENVELVTDASPRSAPTAT